MITNQKSGDTGKQINRSHTESLPLYSVVPAQGLQDVLAALGGGFECKAVCEEVQVHPGQGEGHGAVGARVPYRVNTVL